MKQATGELNATVIVVVIIAVLAVFFFSYLWPMIKDNFTVSAKCDDAICVCNEPDKKCSGKVECYVKGHPEQKIMCTWKG